MSLQGKRIFVVEDNTMNRVVFLMTLTVTGAQVTFDRWGKEALRTLREMRGVDLILLDLMLPSGLTGFDVFREIRSHTEFAEVPIVAVSASEAGVTIPKVRELGFAGFIAKPIDDALFPKQLERIIAGEKIWYDGMMEV